MVVPLLSMQLQEGLRFPQKYLNLCFLKVKKGFKGLERHEAA